jgi:PHD/YefM family antitoxin component YafN of YafNO toxin-antitoxin module
MKNPMQSFAASELQRNSAEIQKAALMGPVFLTYHDKPRYVMMSLDEFVRIQGKEITAHLSTYPQSIASRVHELAKANAESDDRFLAVDKLVLATVNAPYRRSIDAATLQACLAKLDLDRWLVHIATFFTDVAPELVFKFADQHGISRSKLAKAYLAVKKRTGERNPNLETDLGPMATSSWPNYRRPSSSSKKGKSNS